MSVFIENQEIAVKGKLLRTAKLREEPYAILEEPMAWLGKAKNARIRADAFTFCQDLFEQEPKYGPIFELDSAALLPVSTYEHWWKKQLNDKTRNMVRKAQKSGVEVKFVALTDDFVRGICDIYNESPIIQGKPNRFYGKSFEEIRQSLLSFPDRCDFIGAYHGAELIGFVKLVHGRNVSSLLHILSKTAHRDKAPTNALIAKAVEFCAERKISFLHYGIWSRRGLGDFKKHHGFVRFDVTRYYIPLNWKGKLMLALKLHRRAIDWIPAGWQDRFVQLRNRWNSFKYRQPKQAMGR